LLLVWAAVSWSSQSKLAVVGDIHGFWDDADVDYFNTSDYHTILVTGDLGSTSAGNGVQIARQLSRLRARVLVMLGNNDAQEHARIIAELRYQSGRAELLGEPDSTRPRGEVRACGFSAHAIDLDGHDVTLITGRPFAMGGDEVSFPAELSSWCGVSNMAESTSRLCELVDGAASDDLLFLGHNGPRGLGDTAVSLFGRDFDPAAGDWGDGDLTTAIAHAKRSGKRVLGVCAGHMHHPRRNQAPREWLRRDDGTLYVNAARVPRHVYDSNGEKRHHVALSVEDGCLRAQEVWVGDD
jgi:uncharacterized protein (TIGR04168 family)